MHVATLRRFVAEQLADAKAKDILFSVHLKATMMKVADPIVFGQVVSVLLQISSPNIKSLDSLGFNPNLGLSDLEQRIASLPTVKELNWKAIWRPLWPINRVIYG